MVITGQPLRSYAIEVSYDLIDWAPLATTLADSAGTAYFRDKATVHVHKELTELVGGAEPWCALFPVAVPRTNEFTGSIGATESGEGRFYRVVEAP